MYIDEVGNSDLGASHDPNHRYLSLTGVIFDLEYMDSVVAPELEALKRRHFKAHVDEPLIFHRKELMNKNYPFDALRDPEREEAFNADLLDFLERLRYVVVTATIDKLEHVNRYPIWQYHPYHYCQAVLVERFAMSMNRKRLQGDVYGESRGRKPDYELKKSFREIYRGGTDQLPADDIQRSVVSPEIKLKSKAQNVAGLQIADLLAHPSFRWMLALRTNAPTTAFGAQIAAILEQRKYDRKRTGKVDGWGRKWLP